MDDLTFVTDILKRFGIIIYTGNRYDDIILIEMEIEDLYQWKMISDEEYIKARTILRREFNSR
ncbi:hypothetical protein BHF71_02210 [Vulcanibacillus modesticaldus]|uniref:Cytosolic protein n=1 Tax=Vulcanibacillus modesticaldus TaxID=337097 RepID=A0A1D2YUP8_9BACI|nr:YqgQ family protein [Vulcanibacillus modesticaldus]OEF99419.1 hypothetical protein BHF71_02210 [Vulcanibacillus modesticaldus]